jgi:predicted lysophospholipase L1 biosynthesis ABC-type transport system permease subunit
LSPSDRVTAFERIRSEVSSLPGIEHTALAIGTPLGSFFSFGVRVPGRDSLPDLDGPWMYAVSSDYFATVGTTLIAGRLFSSQDGRGTEPVTIISETMARALWPSETALNRCLLIGAGDNVPCARIVGVVRDVRRASLQEKAVMQYYVPLGQERWQPWPYESLELLARPRAASVSMEQLRRSVARAASGAYVVRVASMQDRVDPLLRQWRLGAALFAAFGALAFIVALFGLYAVASYVVSERVPEFGIRLALGSSRTSLFRLVLVWVAKVTALGVAVGGALALAVGSRLEPLLFNQSGRDPSVIVGVAGLVALAMLGASAVPAARAMRVDPLTALRND